MYHELPSRPFAMDGVEQKWTGGHVVDMIVESMEARDGNEL